MFRKLQIFFVAAYIITFFVLIITGKLSILNGIYFPFTLLLFAVMILRYKLRVREQETKTKGTDRLRDELFAVEYFTAIVAALWGLFKIIEYVISL